MKEQLQTGIHTAEETDISLNRIRPQDDIPQEVIERYMIKDYQKMYEKYESIKPVMLRQRLKVKELNYALKIEEAKNVSEEEANHMLITSLKRSQALEESLVKCRAENKDLKGQNDKLTFLLEEMRNNREAIIRDMTEDLETQLEEANRKICLLSEAVSDPRKADSVFLQQCTVHTIETDDDKRWMNSAMKQLEKAAMKLLTVEERMVKVEETIKDSTTGIDIAKALKNFGKAISNITSTISHIECFMDKVGEIKIIDDDES